jgi:hypothetical protein
MSKSPLLAMAIYGLYNEGVSIEGCLLTASRMVVFSLRSVIAYAVSDIGAA